MRPSRYQTKTLQAKFNLRAREVNNSKNVAAKIQEARQCLIDVASLLGDTPKEQTRVLDLISVFRDSVERKELPTTANILSIQVTVLEKAIRKIEKPTEFSRDKTPVLGVQTQPSQPTFAQITQRGTNAVSPTSKNYIPYLERRMETRRTSKEAKRRKQASSSHFKTF